MKINTSTRLEFYSKIKKDFVEDPFLNTVQNFDAKKKYFKLRTSNHCLLVDMVKTPELKPCYYDL